MAKYRIITANLIDWLELANRYRHYQSYFHACFGDWPYNLESIQKRFGSANSVPAQSGTDGAYQRQSKGFMGQSWDTGIAYDPSTWKAIQPLLKPGAFTSSFSHPRTQHRLATAQEDAGYIINPAIYNCGQVAVVPAQLGWIYGSGKPNGTRVDYTIDKAAGAERPVVGTKQMHGHNAGDGSGSFYANGYQAKTGQTKQVDITAPATPLAQIWGGWQYGSPLSPEIEPIVLAQKPYESKRIIDDITKTGAGAINIEFGKSQKVSGRFPGNLVLTHHPECKLLGERTVQNRSGTVKNPSNKGGLVYNGGWGPLTWERHGDEEGNELVPEYDCHPDCRIQEIVGDKARYFYQADWSFEVAEQLAAADPVFYSAKVLKKERNAGCDTLEKKIRNRVNAGGLEKEPRFAPTLQENNHPTLKPIKLCRWLAGLLLPPPEYAPRRILIPCSGTGSEIIGALLAGWDEVIGVELKPEYVEIAETRLAFFADWIAQGQTDIDLILKAAARPTCEDSRGVVYQQKRLV